MKKRILLGNIRQARNSNVAMNAVGQNKQLKKPMSQDRNVDNAVDKSTDSLRLKRHLLEMTQNKPIKFRALSAKIPGSNYSSEIGKGGPGSGRIAGMAGRAIIEGGKKVLSRLGDKVGNVALTGGKLSRVDQVRLNVGAALKDPKQVAFYFRGVKRALQNKMIKGGPGSGRLPENRSKTEHFKPKPEHFKPRQRLRNKIPHRGTTLGRKLGHIVNSTTGSALQGAALGSFAGKLGSGLGAGIGAITGGARGIKNVLRGRVPRRTNIAEATGNLIDAGATYGMMRLPYGKIGRKLGRKIFRR